MFVLNIKIDYKKILFICFILGLLVASIVEFSSKKDIVFTSSKISNYDYDITDENFLSTIEKIHNNIDENISKTIKVQGFVYTMPDFSKDFFVCGRYVNIDNTTQVAGYLCNYIGNMTLEENEWIEVTGTIIRGNYNGEVPVIKVNTITKVPAPANMYIIEKK